MFLKRDAFLAHFSIALFAALLVVIKFAEQTDGPVFQFGEVLLVPAFDLVDLELNLFHLKFDFRLSNALSFKICQSEFRFTYPLTRCFVGFAAVADSMGSVTRFFEGAVAAGETGLFEFGAGKQGRFFIFRHLELGMDVCAALGCCSFDTVVYEIFRHFNLL